MPEANGFDLGYEIRALLARHGYTQNTIESELLEMLRDGHRRAAQEVLSGALSSSATSRRTALFTRAEQLLSEVFPQAQQTADALLGDYARVEQRGAVQRLASLASVNGRGLGILPNALAVELANLPQTLHDIPINGVGFGDWWTKAAQDAVFRLRRELQYGLALGEHPDLLARRIYVERNTKTGQAGGTVWNGSKNSLRMAVRAVATAVQSRATLATIDRMGRDVCNEVGFSAIRDTRTSDICKALDGTRWKLDNPRLPIPPLHPNCRSDLIPIIIGAESLWDNRMSYDQWLKPLPGETPEQTRARQDLALGPTRAQLWRDARISLADLIDADRNPLNLQELDRALTTAFGDTSAKAVLDLPQFHPVMPTTRVRTPRPSAPRSTPPTTPLRPRTPPPAPPARTSPIPKPPTRDEQLARAFLTAMHDHDASAMTPFGVKDTDAFVREYFQFVPQAEYRIAYEVTRVADEWARLRGVITTPEGELVGKIVRTFRRIGELLNVDHDFFALEEDFQGNALSKQTLRGAMATYEQLGVDRITVHANIDIGGYAWARYGFVQKVNAWQEFLGWLMRRAKNNRWNEAFEYLSSLDPDNPFELWRLADSTFGKDLLTHSDWYGTIDMANAEQVARFLDYLNFARKKS